MSADGRFVPVHLGALAPPRVVVFAADANARSIASRAPLRLAAMCSCTSFSIRSPRSQFVFVMRAESHDLDHVLNSTPERLQPDPWGEMLCPFAGKLSEQGGKPYELGELPCVFVGVLCVFVEH